MNLNWLLYLNSIKIQQVLNSVVIGLTIRDMPVAGTAVDSENSVAISSTVSSLSSISSAVIVTSGVLSILSTSNEYGVDSRYKLSSVPKKN